MIRLVTSHFTGSIGPYEYAFRFLLCVAMFIAALLLLTVDVGFIVLTIPLAIYAKISLIGAVVQRLASIGISRWFALLLVVPVVNVLFVLGLSFPKDADAPVKGLPPLPKFNIPSGAGK